MRNTILLLASATLFPAAAAAQGINEAALCRSVLNSNTTQAARPSARAAITERAGSATAAFLNGCIAMADGKADKAADFFEAAAKQEEKGLYYDWMGRAYGDQAQNANKIRQPFLARKTKSAFERAVALDPDNLDARNYLVTFYQLAPGVMGGSDEKARQQIAEIKRRSGYAGQLAQAQYHMRDKKADLAEKEYASMLKTFPDSLQPWNTLIALQVNAKRWGDAFSTVELMRSRKPHLTDYATGRIAAMSGEQLDRGEASLRRYLTITPGENEPTHSNAHYRIAQIQEFRKDIPAARASYQKVIELQPSHADAKKALQRLR